MQGPLARALGIPEDVTAGIGSWFSEGSFAAQDAVRTALPAGTPPQTVENFLAMASMALRQAVYFAARPLKGGGQWAIEVDFGRAMSPAEYRDTIERISRELSGDLFSGSTMVELEPATVQIVLNPGHDAAAAGDLGRRIHDLVGGDVHANVYEVETIYREREGYDDGVFIANLDGRGLQAWQGLDREVDLAWQRLAAGVDEALARLDEARSRAAAESQPSARPGEVGSTPPGQTAEPAPGQTAAPTSTTPGDGPPRLPRDLAGDKPRFEFGGRTFTLNFESDVDRALFIVARERPSKRDADYMAWLRNVLPGMSDGRGYHDSHGCARRTGVCASADPARRCGPTLDSPRATPGRRTRSSHGGSRPDPATTAERRGSARAEHHG